jgi:hypothetical protein
LVAGREIAESRAVRRFLLAAAMLAAFPAAASAGTVSSQNGATTYQGDDRGDAIDATVNNPPAWIFAAVSGFSHYVATPMASGPGCSDVSGGAGTRMRCDSTNTLTVNLAGGDDLADVEGDLPRVKVVNAGSGNDYVGVHGTGSSTIDAGSGDDELHLVGNTSGADAVTLGPGNDIAYDPGFGDVIDGGDGADTVEFTGWTASPVVVSLDAQPNDGSASSPQANIEPSVEHVIATPGADQLDGSAGADTLEGMGGDDVIDGHGGADVLKGEDGNDTLLARDGVADTVDCGPGNDTASVDPADVVTGCETVRFADDDADGTDVRSDCDDHSPAVHPGTADIPGDGIDQDCDGADARPVLLAGVDADGDGSLSPADCDDHAAGVHPGATDTPHDGIDQDCSGADAAYARVSSPVTYDFHENDHGTRVRSLRVTRVPAGGTVDVRCAGPGCPFKTRRPGTRRGSAELRGLFAGHRLRRGAVVEVTVSAPEMIAKVVRFTVRSGRKLPVAQVLCRAPGARRASGCG